MGDTVEYVAVEGEQDNYAPQTHERHYDAAAAEEQHDPAEAHEQHAAVAAEEQHAPTEAPEHHHNDTAEAQQQPYDALIEVQEHHHDETTEKQQPYEAPTEQEYTEQEPSAHTSNETAVEGSASPPPLPVRPREKGINIDLASFTLKHMSVNLAETENEDELLEFETLKNEFRMEMLSDEASSEEIMDAFKRSNSFLGTLEDREKTFKSATPTQENSVESGELNSSSSSTIESGAATISRGRSRHFRRARSGITTTLTSNNNEGEAAPASDNNSNNSDAPVTGTTATDSANDTAPGQGENTETAQKIVLPEGGTVKTMNPELAAKFAAMKKNQKTSNRLTISNIPGFFMKEVGSKFSTPKRPFSQSPSSPITTPVTNSIVATSSPAPTPSYEQRELAQFPRYPNTPRAKVAFELYTTELTFVRILDALVNLFLNPLKLMDILLESEIQSIFSNVEAIREFNGTLLSYLEQRLAQWTPDNEQEQFIGDLFKEMVGQFPIYTVYCNNFDNAISTIAKLEKKKPSFKEFLENTLSDPRCNGISMTGLLITPVQRIPRYNLLFKELVEATSKYHPDYENCIESKTKIEEVAEYVNKSIKESEDARTMSNLRKNIIGLENLENENRKLVHQGSVGLVTPKKRHHCIVFNDLLVFANKKGEIELMLPLEMTWIEDLEDLDPQTTKEDAFEVYTPDRPYSVYAGDLSEKKIWMNAIKKAINSRVDITDEDDPLVRHGQTFVYKDGGIYNGDWHDARRHGHGKYIWTNKTTYEGQWLDNERSGYGVMTYHTTERYEGHWLHDKPHGSGKLITIDQTEFIGEWCEGRKDGKTVINYKNGDMFEGFFKDDNIQGFGKYTCANGSYYEGEWLNSQYHGHGSLCYNGNVYKGSFVANKKEGYGEFVYQDGSKYIGEWKNDLRHGKGKYTTPSGFEYEGFWFANSMDGKGGATYNGDKYEGHFRNGLRQGKGALTTSNGEKYEGNWDADMQHGQGTMYYANGSVYIGNWMNNKRDGFGTFTDCDGSTYEGSWKLDRREGEGTLKYSDGSIYEGQFKDDMRHGRGRWRDACSRYDGEWSYDCKHGRGILITEVSKFDGMWKSNMKHGTGVETTLVGTKYEGRWQNDQKVQHGLLTYSNGATEILQWKYGVLASIGSGSEAIAPQLPNLMRPGSTG